MKTEDLRTERAGAALRDWVVLAVVVIGLLALAIPAVQRLREGSRRRICESNLAGIGLAIQAYASQQLHFPAGTINPTGPIRSEPSGFHHNWLTGLLPHLNAQPLYEELDRSVSVYHEANADVASQPFPPVVCPSAEPIQANTTCYAGSHASTETPIDDDNDGVLMRNRFLRQSDVPDGLSATLFVGEKLSPPEYDLGWISGTRSSLRNAGHPINADRRRLQPDADSVDPLYVGGLASDHPGGAYLLLGSGEVEFRTDEMDLQLLQQLAKRDNRGVEGADVVAPPDRAMGEAGTEEPAAGDAEAAP